MRSANRRASSSDRVMDRTLKKVMGIRTASPSNSATPISTDMKAVRDSTPWRASSIRVRALAARSLMSLSAVSMWLRRRLA